MIKGTMIPTATHVAGMDRKVTPAVIDPKTNKQKQKKTYGSSLYCLYEFFSLMSTCEDNMHMTKSQLCVWYRHSAYVC